MPLGLEKEGFILQCYATVIDDLGGSGTYFIQEVQVGIDKFTHFSQIEFSSPFPF